MRRKMMDRKKQFRGNGATARDAQSKKTDKGGRTNRPETGKS